MKIRNGIDLVRIDRLKNIIAKDRRSFIDRVLTAAEQEYVFALVGNEYRTAERFAGRFAVKEAAAKALGTGLMTDGIGFTDFEVVNDNSGAPELVLHGEALKKAQSLGVSSMAISLTHEGEYAAAVCTFLIDEKE
jgi:phosphopantetheine--protein transferase-like protein